MGGMVSAVKAANGVFRAAFNAQNDAEGRAAVGGLKPPTPSRTPKLSTVVLTFSLAVMGGADVASAQTVPDIPTTITPLMVEEDPAGVNILTGQITLDVPGLSAPAAPRLTYQRLTDFAPQITGRMSAGNGGYSAHLGGKASVSFKCVDYTCTTIGRDGAVLKGFQGTQTLFMPTGETYSFNVKSLNLTTGTNASLYYASSVTFADGETITYTYDTGTYTGDPSGQMYRRPNKVTSSTGYYLAFTYQGNNINTDLGWELVATAGLYRDGPTPILIGKLTYSGTTVTDLLGRVYDTGWGQQITLPGESTPETVVTLNASLPAPRVVSSVARSGASWGYTFLNPVKDVGSGQYKFAGASVVGPGGEITSYVMDQYGEQEQNRIRSVTDPLGRKTSYDYDSKFRVVKVVNPELDSVNITYDAWGNVTLKTSVAKPGSGLANLVEQASYNTASCTTASTDMACFRPLWIKDAKGQQTDFVFNTRGQLTEKTDPADQNGVRTKTIREYESVAPYRVSVERKCAVSQCGTSQEMRTEYSYWGTTFLPSSVRQVDLANSLVSETTFTYDDAGRTLVVNGPLAGTDDATYYRYDTVGRKIWEIGPKTGYGTRPAKKFVYRASDDQVASVDEGWVTDVTDTALAAFTSGVQTSITYGSNRQVSRQTTGSAGVTYQTTDFLYDSARRMTCSIGYMGGVPGNPASSCAPSQTTSANGPDRVTRNVYDAAGQLLQVREGVGTLIEAAEVTYSYTPNGKQEYVIDANGNRAKLEYDGFDRQVKWIFPSPTKPTAYNPATQATALSTAGVLNSADYEQYGYDANGNRTSLRKRDGSVLSYQFDALDRMTKKTVPERSGLDVTHTRDVFFGYDAYGNMTSARFDSASGPGISNTYDALGQLTGSTTNVDGTARALGYMYDLAGNFVRLTHPDSKYFKYVRTAAGALYAVDVNGAGLFYPTYDAAGRVNVLYRRNGMLGTWGPTAGFASTFGYDPVSRLSSLANDFTGTANDRTTSFTYNPASQIASSTRSNDLYAWNGGVNVDRTYTANGLNQYSAVAGTSVTYDLNGNLTSDGTQTYVYDVENRLVSRSGGGTSATLKYDPLGRLYEVTGSATGTTRFLYDGSDLIAEYNASGVMLRRYAHGLSAGDDPLVWFEGTDPIDSTQRRYFFPDERGSIVAVTDGGGNVITRNTYDEYGIPGSANAARFQYTGQVWLPELGMYYYKARMYSPTLGRFMQTDPIGYGDGMNVYAYVANDPVNGVDPTGMYDCQDRVACDATRQAVDEMRAAKKHFESAATGSRIARNAQAGKAIGESLSALGTEGDGNGVTVQVGQLNRAAGELGRHVSDGWGNSTITLDTEAIDASGWSYGAILGHESSHRYSQAQGWNSGPDWRIFSEARGYSVQLNIQLFVNPQIVLDDLGSTRGAAYDWLRRRTQSSACGGLGGYTSNCTGRVDNVFNQMGF